jgi:hypothetical protein
VSADAPLPGTEPRPEEEGRGPDEAARRAAVTRLVWLVLAVVAIASLPVVAPGAVVDWRAQWVAGALIAVATATGAFHLFAQAEPRGVPVESLITPPLVAVAIFASVPASVWLGFHPALALTVALVVGVFVMRGALETELHFVRIGGLPTSDDRRNVEAFALGAAFLVFIGVAATLPGGWVLAEIEAPGDPPLEAAALLGLADAAIAGLAGYRLTALRGPHAAIGWASGSYGVVVGLAAILFRWLAVPGLMAPAVLAVVLYLRAIVPLPGTAADPSARRPLEAIVLALAVIVAVAWQLLGR